MPETPEINDPREALNSWKEIAAFLNVSVRTAQLWEEERNLPVRRLPGVKGRVFAYPADLVAWREGTLPPMEEELAEAAVVEAEPEAPQRKRLWWAVATVVAMVGAVAVWQAARPRGVPSSWTLEGQALVVRGSDGGELWTYRFDVKPDRRWEVDSTISAPMFGDFDHDGEQELLFPLNSGGANAPLNGEYFCFSSAGGVKWKRKMDRTVRTGEPKSWAPPYHARLAARVPDTRGGPDRLLLVFTHATDCASAAVLVDAGGRPLREYWHSGHFNVVLVADLAPGAGAEIYLGAVSNARKAASLIVLDPETFEGAAAEENAKYQILDMPRPRELARVLFQRLSAGPLFSDYGIVSSLRNHEGRLVATVGEDGGGRFYGAQTITFGPGLVLEDLRLASMTYPEYRRVQALGMIEAADPDAEIPRLRELRYLTPWPREQGRSADRPRPPSD